MINNSQRNTQEQNQIIAQLIPLLNEPDFSELFDRLTHDESANSRFLIKMELNRLKAPCQRLIDLRGKVDGECVAYKHQNYTFYLDELAIEIFEKNLAMYGGKYTMGVYERTMATPNNFKIIAQKRWVKQQNPTQGAPKEPEFKSEKKYPAKVIRFANIHGRNEERLHLAVPVIALLPNDKKLYITSSNISITGLRVKMPDEYQFLPESQLRIIFTGLEKEYANSILKEEIPYLVMGSERKNDQQWLRLKLVTDFPEYDEFNQFIIQFIQGYKGRYRVDVKNLSQALTIRGFEQFYLPRMTGLPLFFSGEQPEQMQLNMVLYNENNRQQLEYWRNEHNDSQLSKLFTASRLSSLMADQSLIKSLLIYCFSHTVKGRIFFYTASQAELEATKLKSAFFAFGSRRPSWRVYQLSLFKLNQDTAFVSHIAPHNKREQLIKKDQDKLVKQRISPLSWGGILQEINHPGLTGDYQQNYEPNGNANQLKQFGISTTSLTAPFSTIALKYVQMRSEDRFAYKTRIQLQFSDQCRSGWSVDFSPKGMKVELENSLPVKKGGVVSLALPQFQKLTTSVNLMSLPYEVVNLNQTATILHLKVAKKEHEDHQGESFITTLINKNREKLNIVPEQAPLPGLSESLRNMACQGLCSTPFYVHKRKHHLTIDTVGRSNASYSLEPLIQSNNKDEMNLSPLLQGELFNQLIQQPLKEMDIGEKPIIQELYLAWKTDKNTKQVSVTDAVLGSRFENTLARKLFVTDALNKGQFSAVLIVLSRTGRPDMDYIANELAYISHYAIHKAKELEDNLWSVAGVGEFIDISAETLARLSLRVTG